MSDLHDVIEHIATLNALRGQLENIRREIEAAGYLIQATWMDEYGGEQSIKLGNTDRLTIVSKENCP